jgi:hypothetical protein
MHYYKIEDAKLALLRADEDSFVGLLCPDLLDSNHETSIQQCFPEMVSTVIEIL